SSHRMPPREITVPPRSGFSPADPSITQARQTIAQLRATKWESGFNVWFILLFAY
ncbi:hypothetical protein MKW94_007525, partial [Papaver nudicaule]|nr:hypothetical protein [Papaver nudicaule]